MSQPAPAPTRRLPKSRWRVAGDVLLLAAIPLTLYFALFEHFRPGLAIVDTLRGHGDRNLHVAAFAVLVWLTMTGRRTTWAVPALFAIAATALEFAQLAAPGRSVDAVDLAASLLGIVLGTAVAAACNAVLRRQRLART